MSMCHEGFREIDSSRMARLSRRCKVPCAAGQLRDFGDQLRDVGDRQTDHIAVGTANLGDEPGCPALNGISSRLVESFPALDVPPDVFVAQRNELDLGP